MIYGIYEKGGFKVPGFHDPSDRRPVGLLLRPPVWEPGKVYMVRSCCDADVVLPTVFTGVYYKVKSAGKSGAVEPKWSYAGGSTTLDGNTGLVWETQEHYSLLKDGEDIATVGLVPTNGVTVTGKMVTESDCKFYIDPFTAPLSEFCVKAHVTTTLGAEMDYTLIFKVAQR